MEAPEKERKRAAKQVLKAPAGAVTFDTRVKKVAEALNAGRLRKKLRRQGARTLRSEAYFSVRCNDEG